MPAIRLEIVGQVQGVGFRWFVVEQARGLRLAGWVRNRPDGAVELAAAGESGALEALRAAVQAGPPGARVQTVRDLPAPPESILGQTFRVAR